MGLILKQLFGLLKLLNSDTGSNQIATGIAAGFVLGMTPFFSLQSILIFFCIFIFRIQIGAVFLSAFFFKFIAYLLDPAFHAVGSQALELTALQGFYTYLFNLPIIPFTRFNNTVVMGSGLVSIALTPLIFLISKSLIIRYRILVVSKLKQTKFWKAMAATSIYKWYYSYDNLYR